MPLTSAIFTICWLTLSGTYTECGMVLLSGFLGWLIVFILWLGGLFLFFLYSVIEINKFCANFIFAALFAARVQAANESLCTASLFSNLVLRHSRHHEVGNQFFPVHGLSISKITIAIIYSVSYMKSIAHVLFSCITIVIFGDG